MKKIVIDEFEDYAAEHERGDYSEAELIDWSSNGEVWEFPKGHQYLDGQQPVWGDPLVKADELNGGEQLALWFNLLHRFKFRPQHIIVQTTYGEPVELRIHWNPTPSKMGKPFHTAVETVNGVEFRKGREFFHTNDWPDKLGGAERDKAGYRPDPPIVPTRENIERIKNA